MKRLSLLFLVSNLLFLSVNAQPTAADSLRMPINHKDFPVGTGFLDIPRLQPEQGQRCKKAIMFALSWGKTPTELDLKVTNVILVSDGTVIEISFNTEKFEWECRTEKLTSSDLYFKHDIRVRVLQFGKNI